MSEKVCKKCGRPMRTFELLPHLKGLMWCWYLFCSEYNKKIQIEEEKGMKENEFYAKEINVFIMPDDTLQDLIRAVLISMTDLGILNDSGSTEGENMTFKIWEILKHQVSKEWKEEREMK